GDDRVQLCVGELRVDDVAERLRDSAVGEAELVAQSRSRGASFRRWNRGRHRRRGRRRVGRTAGQQQHREDEDPRTPHGRTVALVPAFEAAGSVAGVPGLEPRTTEPESAVLPITPYPTG